MGLLDDFAKARADRPEPIMVDVAIGDGLYKVEVTRLDGMAWAAIMAECPPEDAGSARLGYSPSAAALLACKRFARLFDAEGEPVADVDWGEVFAAISGVEVQAIAASWWALNMGDPNQRVVDLKKASAAGGVTSSS